MKHKDKLGREIKIGSGCAFAVRSGSSPVLTLGKVEGFSQTDGGTRVIFQGKTGYTESAWLSNTVVLLEPDEFTTDIFYPSGD